MSKLIFVKSKRGGPAPSAGFFEPKNRFTENILFVCAGLPDGIFSNPKSQLG
jgi:hypothetical protein